MKIKSIMTFEGLIKVHQQGPQGEQRDIDAFIAPTSTFILPYIPWPLNFAICVLVEGLENDEEFKIEVINENDQTRIIKIEGNLGITSSIPKDKLSVTIPFNFQQVTIKNEGVYKVRIKLGHLAWNEEYTFSVLRIKESSNGTEE